MLLRYRCPVELRHLRYFVAVGRALNFTRASEQLRVAQPALSRQIRQLEAEIGNQLLERDRRHVRLTRAGELFLKEAEALLLQSQYALDLVRGVGSDSDPLTVGYVWGLFHTLAPAAVKQFRSRHPDVPVNLLDLSTTRQVAALREGSLDLGFIGISGETLPRDLQEKQIGRVSFMAVLPDTHPLTRRRTIPLNALDKDLFLTISETEFPGTSALVREACEAAGLRPRLVQASDRGHAILGMVGAGCGVAILPETLKELPHPGVTFRPVAPTIEASLVIAWSTKPSTPRRDAFLEAMHDGLNDR